ncbi:hypothetical protein [Candidatus Accumulibacter sp. ACC007]|uniref:hypothetical protein n=1 Tax=Candidatus Accumulibacter sp. ACC007 TaxID=2823333 RepID=UPI0025C5DAD2|nr:hypothetical protein [Candidatus Accumulibacter sp. ACC007]
MCRQYSPASQKQTFPQRRSRPQPTWPLQSSLKRPVRNDDHAEQPGPLRQLGHYTSNSYSGFTVSAIYGFGESNLGGYNNASTSDNGKAGLGVNYANGR